MREPRETTMAARIKYFRRVKQPQVPSKSMQGTNASVPPSLKVQALSVLITRPDKSSSRDLEAEFQVLTQGTVLCLVRPTVLLDMALHSLWVVEKAS